MFNMLVFLSRQELESLARQLALTARGCFGEELLSLMFEPKGYSQRLKNFLVIR